MTIVLLEKGTEDIFYCRIEGDIIVNYYLLCETDNNDHVKRTCAFGYGSSKQTYFDMNTEETEKIRTMDEAQQIDIAVYSASLDQECRLSTLMEIDGDFFVEWMKHKKEKYWEEDEEENDD